jgi:hypothetical protein
MPHVRPKYYSGTLSYWGDCIVYTGRGGSHVAIFTSDGKLITQGKEEERSSGRNQPGKFRQTELFGSDFDTSAKIVTNPDLFVPPGRRQDSQETPKKNAVMDSQAEGEN